MKIDEKLSLVMGSRLREEREKMGLSHIELARQIQVRYGIDISRDSLMNYEVAEETHSKKYKNNGMRIEYLRCLASFYNVSADWLLGISNVRSQSGDVKTVCAYTGLNENSVSRLHDVPHFLRELGRDGTHWVSETINSLLMDEADKNIGDGAREYRSVLALINFFLSYKNKTELNTLVYPSGETKRFTGNVMFSESAIVLDEQMIENAALLEMQRALISLKRELRKKMPERGDTSNG